MIISNGKFKGPLFICPRCEEDLSLTLSLPKGSIDFGDLVRSDLFRNDNYGSNYGPVYRCGKCGYIFFIDKAKYKKLEFDSIEEYNKFPCCENLINFNDIKEAVEILDDGLLNIKEERALILQYIYSYNDIIRHNKEGNAYLSEDKHHHYIKYLNRYIDLLEDGSLKAEFLRESGRFDECIEYINNLTFKIDGKDNYKGFLEDGSSGFFPSEEEEKVDNENFNKKMLEVIKRKAEAMDLKVFIIHTFKPKNYPEFY